MVWWVRPSTSSLPTWLPWRRMPDISSTIGIGERSKPEWRDPGKIRPRHTVFAATPTIVRATTQWGGSKTFPPALSPFKRFECWSDPIFTLICPNSFVSKTAIESLSHQVGPFTSFNTNSNLKTQRLSPAWASPRIPLELTLKFWCCKPLIGQSPGKNW